jgi:hypothetical protein
MYTLLLRTYLHTVHTYPRCVPAFAKAQILKEIVRLMPGVFVSMDHKENLGDTYIHIYIHTYIIVIHAVINTNIHT